MVDCLVDRLIRGLGTTDHYAHIAYPNLARPRILAADSQSGTGSPTTWSTVEVGDFVLVSSPVMRVGRIS
jgi:hypothetical protein